MSKLKDIAGQKFGLLTVREYVGNGNWLCVCDCGGTKTVKGTYLRSGNVKSCGCLGRPGRVKHGKSSTRLYRVWTGMKSRCYCKTDEHYEYYGGRGIKVCDEWKHDFGAFHDWAMANGYNPDGYKHECTLDRIDNNGDYCPENCRWASLSVQMSNRRHCRSKPKLYKPVEEIDSSGVVINVFESVTAASVDVGCSPSSMTGVCNGHRHTVKGRMFRYAKVPPQGEGIDHGEQHLEMWCEGR